MRSARLLVLALVALAGCGDVAPEADRRSGTEGEGEEEGGEERTRGPAVAITIDDLPWVGPLPPGWTRMGGTDQILAALASRQAPATGFVNCGRVSEGAPVLRRWLEAGHTLGNHTQQHLDLNYADPDAWAADARQCDRFLRELTDAGPLPFRYPYLHRGPTAERHRAGRRALDSLGTIVAPVTINTGDWILDDPYVAAVRASDEEKAEAIASAYVAHISRAAGHYREVARERVGREIPHILLLHANALLAAQLPTVLSRLEEEGFRFIPLEAALRDPVYARQDAYVGPEGLSWLYRIAPAVPSAQQWDTEEAATLRAAIR